jgi:excisionase family DNA binding protein
MPLKLLTTKQAAKALAVNDSRVRQFILSGRLPAQKFGRDWIIKEKDLKRVADRKPGRPKKGRI